MADKSGIEWTDATWNPVTGCTKISAGCDNCYAEVFAERWRGIAGHPYEQGFDLKLHPDRLSQPLKWKRPRKIFVNSMSDLFHKDIPQYYQNEVFSVMRQAHWHTFQVLTKRSSLMRDYVNHNLRFHKEGLTEAKNIWLGVSVENAQAKSRIKHLQETRAAVRFLSIEPLIEPLGVLDLSGIHWVIVGGESGNHARPCAAEWVREIRDQCLAAGVPFLFKQWGGRTSKIGGRELDGQIYDGYPEVAA